MKFKFLSFFITYCVSLIFNFHNLQAQESFFSDKTLATEIITSNGIETNLDDVFGSLEFNNVFILIYDSNKTDFIENLPKIKDLQISNPDFKYVYIATNSEKENWQSLVKSFELNGMNIILKKPVDFSINDELEIDINSKIIVLNKKKEIVFRRNIQTSFTEIDSFLKGLKYFK